MHVAASAPEFLKRDDVTEEQESKVKEVFQKEVEGKPSDIQDKIMQGKVSSYFDEKVLLDQKFIKDPDKKISDLIESGIQKFGERIEVLRFVRYSVN